jgi:ribosomal protein S18 acetylase RimI-like enzyme
MPALRVDPVTRATLPGYVQALTVAFRPKFAQFFRGIPEDTYQAIMVDLIWDTRPGQGDVVADSYVVVDPTSPNEVLGAILIKDGNCPRYPRSTGWRTLRQHLSLWRALRSGAWLDAFSNGRVARDELYLDSLGVLPEAQGRGLGTVALQFCEEAARARGCRILSLYVSCKNPRAQALYERFGMRVTGVRRSWLAKRTLGIPAFHRMEKVVE